MAYYNATVEPYQEQAGAQTAASNPDELQAFYADMQKREVERKKSKRMSHTGSIWSRKSVKRSAGQATAVATRASSSQPQQQQHQRPPASSSSVSLAKDTAVGAQPAGNSNDREMEKQDETRDVATPLTMSRSIIPDALNELPAWYSKDDSATYMMRYNLHNPVGPRRYYNHHLIPPSQKKPASRPPSIFSPSFPPMATSSQDSDDLTRLAGPSRTPSHSPLPTPSSSQVGVGDVGGVPRSRKTSQTAHDGVDLLDVSDPWGTNWHHQSPYDIGLTHNVVSVDPQERSRHTSVTTRETRRRTVTPSPLSQSTSAIHLAPPSESGRIHRKLSKRRTSTLGLFGHGDSKSLSAPTTPLDEKLSSMSIVDTRDILGPSVSAPPSAFKSASLLSKKERRGSVLGRIVKKFSILRKSHPIEKEDSHNMVVVRSHSPEKAAQKRVPPPVLDEPLVASPEPLPTPPTPPTPLPEEQPREREQPQEREYRLSLSSIEQPISMGKLTIANPDVPSLNSTPQQQHMPLPAETESTVVPESPPIPSHSYHHFPTPAQPAPSIQSSTAHAPSMGTASPVPSSSMQVLSETMRPDVRTSPQKLIPSSPTQLRRKSSPTKAEHLHGATSPATKRSSQPNGAAFPTAAPPVAANGPSQEKRKSRSPEKKPAPPMVPPKPTAAVVPFPEVQQSTQSQPEPTVPAYLTSMISSYHDVIDNSPMSAASLLVNPPTPNLPIDLPIPPSSPAPTLPPKDFKRSNREPSPSGVSKQTETFKLIRSVSGSVYASTETIIAAGQQWEVVEDKGKNKDASSAKSKTRSKDKDKESRREHRKEKERGEDRESRKHSHKGSRRSADVAMAGAALHNSQRRANSVEIHNRAPIPEFQKPQESSARRSVDIPVNVNKPQPPPPPPTQGVSHSRPLERNPSRSARPTSEVPTAADLNATRGREAWEMERLFKAQSMYGMGATIGLTASAPVVAPPVVHDATSKASHGSGHTSYTVQNAFSNQPASHIYHSIPSHSQSFPQNLDRSANDIRHTAPSFSTSHSSPADLLPVSRPNPLPEPPRDSPYQPGNIDALLDSTTSDYWTKFTGVTTAH